MTSLRIGRKGLLAAVIVGLCLAAYFVFVPERFGDFRAFYCSGRALIVHSDPYREHPLRECERTVEAPGVSELSDDVTIPAPFPGYVLALFGLLSLLPFGVAAGVWLTALLVSLVVSTILVARCLGIRFSAAAIAIGFPTVAVAIRVGQATPLAALAMALTAYMLMRGKPRTAAFVVLGVAVEPHIAPAIFAALFIGDHRTRIPLVVGGLMLLGLSVVSLGVPMNVEYARDVLPAHALANVPDLAQFSFAHFLYIAGVDPDRARAAGSLWYFIAATLGVGVALKLRASYGVAALVFVPPAFEAFGGVHVHLAQLALAVPGLFLAVRPCRLRPALVFALFFAAIPWLLIANFPMLVPAIAVLGIGFAIAMDVEGLALALSIAASTLALVLFGTSLVRNGHVPLVVVHSIGNPLADVSWSVLMRQWDGFAPISWFILAKVPTLASFAVLLTALGGAAAKAGYRDRLIPRSSSNRKVRAASADR